jgi:hypothetical protein
MPKRSFRTIGIITSAAMLTLVGAAGTSSASAQTHASAKPTVVSNDMGTLKVRPIHGETAKGATFAGQFVPTRFVASNGKLRVVGQVTGTLTKKSGAEKQVNEKAKIPLNKAASANKNSFRSAAFNAAPQALVSCQVLDLVLGPLDLDLLGLVVHLDRVHLNITAVPGAGNLLGNLLCAVAGLLDGITGAGLNQILANLLIAILGLLGT